MIKHLSVFGHQASASPATGNSQGFYRRDGMSWAPSMSWAPGRTLPKIEDVWTVL